jgi:hypothetical protein
MPNSMTSLEINDVLSSIRRLVSGDKSGMENEPARKDDFFVLTPAHRIEPVYTGAEDLPDLSGSVAPNAEPPTAPPIPLELTNPAFPVAEANAEDQSGDGDDDAALAGAPVRMALVPDIELTPEPPTNNPAPSLEDRIAELEEAVSRSDDDWEPDGSEPDDVHLPVRHLFEIVDNNEVPEDAATESDGELPPVMMTEFSHTGGVGVEVVSDSTPDAPLKLADVATFSHVHSDPRQPERVELSNTIVEAPVSEEVVEGNDDIFVDEDLLRRVVSDIVREELQGKLGERITRNLRRMVRREIEQTLSLKDFD